VLDDFTLEPRMTEEPRRRPTDRRRSRREAPPQTIVDGRSRHRNVQ
jgi:hypothetical protein